MMLAIGIASGIDYYSSSSSRQPSVEGCGDNFAALRLHTSAGMEYFVPLCHGRQSDAMSFCFS